MPGRQRHSRKLFRVKVVQQTGVWRALLCNCREHAFIVESHLMTPKPLAHWLLIALLLGAPQARGQAVCSSDGQPLPRRLVERFINADCDTCWADPVTNPTKNDELALDWIVPGSQNDEAPLAAAASSDAWLRLSALKHARPTAHDSRMTDLSPWPEASLRLAHGVALGGYVGASIEFRLPKTARLDAPPQAWLVLVETLTQGSEGSPVSRNLVRNVFQPSWNMHNSLLIEEQLSFKETRPLSIPPGANPQRLRLVGWVQDSQGQTLLATQTVCEPPDESEKSP